MFVGKLCVAYHRTKRKLVKPITKYPLQSGFINNYGKGIYCSTHVESAVEYCGSSLKFQTKHGIKKYEYVFMCRVNYSKILKCTQSSCPEDENPEYTLYFIIWNDYWFVNYNTITFKILVHMEFWCEKKLNK
jgi:hypothetical protein